MRVVKVACLVGYECHARKHTLSREQWRILRRECVYTNPICIEKTDGTGRGKLETKHQFSGTVTCNPVKSI